MAAPPSSSDSVIVGLRIRPLLSRDLNEGARECLRKIQNEPQVVIGADRPFTYNHVFSPTSTQTEVFEECMRPLVDSVLEGYHATVLAYGQTGSGKTHTMGSSCVAGEEMPASGEAAGLIPRAIGALFEKAGATEGLSMQATATFIEIYKEEVHDLLSWKENINPDGSGGLATLPIRENGPDGGLTLTGQQSKGVVSVDDCMGVLAEGARNRATGATAMNASSSRSHAIFTLALQIKTADGKSFAPKLHFVDLAGSERAKRTGASGERLQEGIQINKGLLALGNVINALCEKHHHVPYRDSKLTRLLQDSLGGNSKTLMLACVSPGDTDMEETLNTLKYANRARQIRNKPLLAQDPNQARISELMEQINMLSTRLSHYEAGGAPLPPLSEAAVAGPSAAEVAPTGAAPTGAAPTVSSAADGVLLRRVTQLQKENETLKKRIATLVAGGATPSASAGMPTGGVSSSGQQPALATLLEEGAEENANNDGSTSHRSSSGSSDAPSEGTLEAAQALGSLLTSEEESAYAQEAMEAELEFQVKQGELTEELEGLNASLALKQALLAQQPEEGEDGDAEAEEEIKHLCEALQSLEDKLKNVETERDAFHRQVSELRMHSDESGQPSKAATQKLEKLEAEIARLKKQRAQQEALLKARQASEHRVKQLEGEITTIKAQRVELTRRQREEAEAHRAQRMARERELKQLKRREEKQQATIAKLEGEQHKQQLVIKRKNEELEKEKNKKMRPDGAGGAAAGPSKAPVNKAFGGGAVGDRFGGPPPPSARKPVGGGGGNAGGMTERRMTVGGGFGGMTAASQARIDGKKEEDLQKAVTIMGQKPKAWLEGELSAILEQQTLREQVNVQLEMRRQASLRIKELEIRNSEESTMEVDGEEGAREAEAVKERSSEIESLKIKIDHHNREIDRLQSKMIKDDREDACTKKLDALREVKDAKALLKVSVHDMVKMKHDLAKKDRTLERERQNVNDATDLANGLRLRITKQAMEISKREKEVDASHKLIKELQDALNEKAPAPERSTLPKASTEEPPKPSTSWSDLDERLKIVKEKADKSAAYTAETQADKEAKIQKELAAKEEAKRKEKEAEEAKIAKEAEELGRQAAIANLQDAEKEAKKAAAKTKKAAGKAAKKAAKKVEEEEEEESMSESSESEDDSEDDGARASDCDYEPTPEKPKGRPTAKRGDTAAASAAKSVQPIKGMFDAMDDENGEEDPEEAAAKAKAAEEEVKSSLARNRGKRKSSISGGEAPAAAQPKKAKKQLLGSPIIEEEEGAGASEGGASASAKPREPRMSMSQATKAGKAAKAGMAALLNPSSSALSLMAMNPSNRAALGKVDEPKANVPGSPAAVSFEEHQSRWNKANKASKNSTRFVGDGSGAEEAMERI